jgi:hypothetical protein
LSCSFLGSFIFLRAFGLWKSEAEINSQLSVRAFRL